MISETDQTRVWTGDFGREYTERNSFESAEEFNNLYKVRYGRARDEMNREWLADVPRDARILEIGANVGYQLESLRRIGFRHLHGLEVQRYCVEKAKALHPQVDVVEGSALEIPFRDGYFDLVFTNNVLIHIAQTDLPKVVDEMVRVSRRYIWGFEYYADQFTEVFYRGHQNLLWKGDFAGVFQARHPELKVVRAEMFPCLDEPGNVDKQYLLEKA